LKLRHRGRQPKEKDVDDSRIALVIAVERMALAMRYLVYLLVLALYLIGELPGDWLNLLVITAVLLLHNAFAHLVLWKRRYSWFFTKLNYFVYLAEASLVVIFTGAESSEAYVLFLFLIIGFSAYSQRFRAIMIVAISCCAVFLAIVLAEHMHHGLRVPYGSVVVKLSAIFICGWLVGSLSRLLQRMELNATYRSNALAASETTLRTILDTTADPILVYDEREFIIEANSSACRFLAVPREALIGRRFRSFLFDDGTLPQRFASLRARGEYRGELIMLDAEGREFTVDLKARSFVRELERYFVCVARDISAQKDYQEASQLANENLERLNRELRQLNDLKAGFLTSAAQKLRSPLAALLGYLDLLINEELGEISDDQRKALHTCRRSALRLLRVAEETPTFTGGGARQ
jgi:PAS domain S-box-containing protein